MAIQTDTNPVATALRKVLPAKFLPPGKTYETLADELVLALAGSYALVPKRQYDSLVRSNDWAKDKSGRW